MEWLSQNWVWLALGIGVIFLIGRGGFGHCIAMHRAHDHGRADGRAAPAGDPGQAGTSVVADTASSGVDAKAAPAAHRRHGCC